MPDRKRRISARSRQVPIQTGNLRIYWIHDEGIYEYLFSRDDIFEYRMMSSLKIT
jgi:hypothetical protein